MFFFKPYVVGIIIPQTNIHLQEEKHHPVSYGEFLHRLGWWLLMATINSPECTNFWSMGEVDCFVGAPMRLGTGDCDSWKGTMEEVPFHVYAMKEPDYIMSLMSICGTNQRSGKETTREWVDGSGNSPKTKFNYPEVDGTASCTATPLMITTISDTHLSVWMLCLGNEVLAQSSLKIPPELNQSECQPGCNILLWPRTNGSDQRLQEIGQDIDLQYPLQ